MSVTVTVPGNTVNELLKHWASTPDSYLPAFVGVDESGQSCSITRREVFEYGGRFAHKLEQLGVTKGTIVCSTLPNSIERIVCDMGIYLAGATSLNGQIFHSDGHDFFNSLRATKTKYVIVNPDTHKGAFKVLKYGGVEVVNGCVRSEMLPHLKHVIFCGRNSEEFGGEFIRSLQNPDLPQLCVDVDPSDIATVMTSSGSTGYSKLIQLTHANLCHFTKQVKAIYPLKGGDRFINCAPIGWAGGFPQWYLGCGMTRYFLDLFEGPPKNLPRAVWDIIVRKEIIYGFVSPMYVGEILRNHSWWENSDWKPNILCLAGQPIKKEQLDIIGKLCDAVDINYGMTECNLVTTHRVTDLSSFKDGCAGFPGQGVALKVVDKQRNVLPPGTIGEILLQSPALTPGYLNNEDANRLAFTSDGWLCTDDVGYIDSDGRLYVEGRQSDSILRGAYILYPGWLEKEIKKMSNVKDVVVVPVPDPILHNEICACVMTDGVPNQLVRISPKNKGSVYINDSSMSLVQSSLQRDSHEISQMNAIDETEGQSHSSKSGKCEQIHVSEMRKTVNIEYNVNKARNEEGTSKTMESKVEEGSAESTMQSLENDLRQKCDQNQLLAEKDAMRMVPKYYVFWEKFPLTATGKINRKEVGKEASILLGLQ